MAINKNILKSVSHHAIMLLDHKLNIDYCYHNVDHTLNTVNAAIEIGEASGISTHQKDILSIAAWFHDIGYIWRIEGHERISALFAHHYLQEMKVDQDDIEAVKNCILATRYPQRPAGILEEIICDADLIHLGSKDFLQKAALVRKEWQLTRHLAFTDREWNALNLEFLSSHSFHTAYCRYRYEKRKQKNIRKLERWYYSNRFLNKAV